MINSPGPIAEKLKVVLPENGSEKNARGRVAETLKESNRLTHEQRLAARNLPWFFHQQKELDRLNGEKFDLFIEKLSQIFGKTIDWLPNVKLSPNRRWLDIPDGPFLKALRATTQPPKIAPRVSRPKHRPVLRKALKVEIVAVRETTSKKGTCGYLVTEKIGHREVKKFYENDNLSDKARAFMCSNPVAPELNEMAKAA